MRTKKPTVQKTPVSSRSISKKVKDKTPLDKTKTVTDRDKRKYIDYKIYNFLENAVLVGHNLEFDIKFIMKSGPYTTIAHRVKNDNS